MRDSKKKERQIYHTYLPPSHPMVVVSAVLSSLDMYGFVVYYLGGRTDKKLFFGAVSV